MTSDEISMTADTTGLFPLPPLPHINVVIFQNETECRYHEGKCTETCGNGICQTEYLQM
jgi:hypothetical protein